MKQELITLIPNANNAINSLENYLFTNHREFYIYSKCRIDACKEGIAYVNAHLEEFNEEELGGALEDVKLIIQTINEAQLGYENLANQIAAGTNTSEEGKQDFTEEELNGLLNALDSGAINNLLPEIEQAIPNETQMAPTMNQSTPEINVPTPEVMQQPPITNAFTTNAEDAFRI